MMPTKGVVTWASVRMEFQEKVRLFLQYLHSKVPWIVRNETEDLRIVLMVTLYSCNKANGNRKARGCMPKGIRRTNQIGARPIQPIRNLQVSWRGITEHWLSMPGFWTPRHFCWMLWGNRAKNDLGHEKGKWIGIFVITTCDVVQQSGVSFGRLFDKIIAKFVTQF